MYATGTVDSTGRVESKGRATCLLLQRKNLPLIIGCGAAYITMSFICAPYVVTMLEISWGDTLFLFFGLATFCCRFSCASSRRRRRRRRRRSCPPHDV